MIERYPREPLRFPRDITIDDVEQATQKNGSVDLSKIRSIKNRRVGERKAITARASETRKKHKELFNNFIVIYKKFMGVEFIANNRNRIISYRNSEGKLIRSHRKTDLAKLIEFYEGLNNRYKISFEDFKNYILHSMKIAVVELEFVKQNQIFGFVMSDKVADKYFVRLKRKEVRKESKKYDRTRHLKYFRNKDER